MALQILVIDDELDHLNAICDVLQGGPYRVLRTCRPERALEIAENDLPDLIITDWDMPGLSGIDLIQMLKEREATRDIPVIMCTGKMTSCENLETALDAGAVDYIRKPVEAIELRARTRSMLHLSSMYRQIKAHEQELARQNELLRQQKQKLHIAATTDRLTGVYNRAFLLDHLEREFANSRRYGHPLTCLMLDIDHFKAINDQHGHAIGDMVIRNTAQVLAANIRKGDVLARFGGEEFVVLLSNTTARDGAALAESLRSAVDEALHRHGSLSLRVGVSVGVADTLFDESMSESDLIAYADEALYAAKRRGRNRVVIYGSAANPGLG